MGNNETLPNLSKNIDGAKHQNRSCKMSRTLLFGVALLILSFAGCDGSGNAGTTYFYQSGIVSIEAHDAISRDMGIAEQSGLSAQRARDYCNQWSIYGETVARRGCTRLEIERFLEPAMDFTTRTKFLRLLNSDGAAFQIFTMEDDEYYDVVEYYYYVEKEESEGSEK
jgi:hypothetical protein